MNGIIECYKINEHSFIALHSVVFGETVDVCEENLNCRKLDLKVKEESLSSRSSSSIWFKGISAKNSAIILSNNINQVHYDAKNIHRGYVMMLELYQRGGTSESGLGRHIVFYIAHVRWVPVSLIEYFN